LPPDHLARLAKNIVHKHASGTPVFKLDRCGPEDQDHVREKMVMMTTDLLDWVLLGRAIKMGDVGLMKCMLPRLFYRFHGGSNPNYAIEIAKVMQGFAHEWPEDLQYVVHIAYFGGY
jgi:hypothetical protein